MRSKLLLSAMFTFVFSFSVWAQQTNTTTTKNSSLNAVKQLNDHFVNNARKSTKALSNKNSVVIFPNPAHHTLNVRSSGGKETFDRAMIFTTYGKLIKSAGKGSTKIDIRSLPAGTYFVRVQSNGNTITKKLIKE
ncbi:T9SS type A sorting domain-containing protein [uncultured Microscilla sp.]|uniref:T9SS type A sorting domain-containing protein n=1 Tax=uncultured Microscilla sp. TaxID=432653 RepID=UPI00261F7975|nr:T9SS type A sorting domain-containing protein [uncultured Microscilla sp.]